MPQIEHAVKVIEKDLSYNIIGCCFKTHKKLGRFAKEKQYGDELKEWLKQMKISYIREYEIKDLQVESPKGNRVDFLIEGKIVLDLKAKPFITKEDYYQMQRYLKAADLELGIIVNFHSYKLVPKRVLNGSYSGHLDINSGY